MAQETKGSQTHRDFLIGASGIMMPDRAEKRRTSGAAWCADNWDPRVGGRTAPPGGMPVRASASLGHTRPSSRQTVSSI